MKKLFYASFLVSIVLLISISCSRDDESDYYNLNNLPEDSGGTQIANPLGTNAASYGYYIYLPSGYDSNVDAFYPILVFLHGSGEKGNSQNDPEILDKVLANGPPKMIKNKTWNPPYPMIVVSPQCHESWWEPQKLKTFVEFILEEYRINQRRIYITGLSMGGYGCFSYVGTYGNSSYVAATVPICGGGNTNQASKFNNIPVWAFHGEADETVLPSNSIDMIQAIRAANPFGDSFLTIFPGIGHNSWDYTYTGTGIGKESAQYDPFNMSIYDWMLQYERRDLDTLFN